MFRSNNVAKPTPEQIAAFRKRHSLTQQKAADLVYSTTRTWQNWEHGSTQMERSTWELLLIKAGELPA